MSALFRTIRTHHGHRKQYRDASEAKQASLALHGPGGWEYRCPVCGWWHVISPRKVQR